MTVLLKKLPREFYNRETTLVAKELLGCYLVHFVESIEYIGKIVEVEAYLGPHDLACHSAKGLTPRTATMFGPPGHAYVYLIYGLHYCFNVVTESAGFGAAVLIRALEPIAHIHTKTSGPGLLTKAMMINKTHNGCDLISNTLFIAQEYAGPGSIIAKPRIGVAYAQEWAHELLRFYIKDNPFVSKR